MLLTATCMRCSNVFLPVVLGFQHTTTLLWLTYITSKLLSLADYSPRWGNLRCVSNVTAIPLTIVERFRFGPKSRTMAIAWLRLSSVWLFYPVNLALLCFVFSAAGQRIKQSQNNSLEAQTSASTDMFCSSFSSCSTQGELNFLIL